VDRELYIPRSWTCDTDRCRATGLDEDTVFATKPELAARMIGRFLDAGHRVGWVAGDEVYGGNPTLRPALEERKAGYVLAVACPAEVTTGAGKFRADALAARVPKRAWQKLPAGAGAKGHRFYHWAVIDLAEPRPGCHRLLIRRNRTTGELPYYRCFSPAPVPLATLVRVAGSRWRRRLSRPERAWPDWTSTRSGASPHGPAGSPWPCSLTPSSPSSAPTNTPAIPPPTG
jgi:SRSO17 transposase